MRILIIALIVVPACVAAIHWLAVEDESVAANADRSVKEGPAPMPEEPSRSALAATQIERSAKPPLWRVVDESLASRAPDYPTHWSTEGRVLVRVLDAAKAARDWRVGDRLTIEVPQLGQVHQSRIDEIDEGPGGSRAALGWVEGADGRARRFVLTVGRKSMFAFIDTAEGPYELLANAELGWLLPTASMMAGVDFSQTDTVPRDEEPVFQELR